MPQSWEITPYGVHGNELGKDRVRRRYPGSLELGRGDRRSLAELAQRQPGRSLVLLRFEDGKWNVTLNGFRLLGVTHSGLRGPEMLAVVTGASAGIGEAFATRLASEGWDLVITARRRQRLETLAERLIAAHENKVRVLVADLTETTEVSQLLQLVSTEEIDLLVNNAGFGGYGPFAEKGPEVIDDLIAVHISAVSQLSRAVLPRMIQRNGGAVINVASLLAFSGTMPPQPLPYRATYAGAKAYLVAFTQALAGELADTAVRVQVCCPGLVDTEFHADFDLSNIQLPVMDPKEVVDAAMKALADGEVVCVPGLEDPGMIEQLGDIQRTMMLAAASSGLATRYRPS